MLDFIQEMERKTWDALTSKSVSPNLVQTPSRPATCWATEPDVPTIVELDRAMREAASSPAGIAMNGRLLREVEWATARCSATVTSAFEYIMGSPLVEDPDIPDGVAYVFHDRGLWRAYLQHLADRRDAERAVHEARTILAQAEARDRQRRLSAPFRFEAHVDRGLIVEARFNAVAREQ